MNASGYDRMLATKLVKLKIEVGDQIYQIVFRSPGFSISLASIDSSTLDPATCAFCG